MSLSLITWELVSGVVDGLSSGLRGSIVGVLANRRSNGEMPSSLGVVFRPHCIGGSREGQSLVFFWVISTLSWLLMLRWVRSHTALPLGWYGDECDMVMPAMFDISVHIWEVNSLPLSECSVLGIPNVGSTLSNTTPATVLAVWSLIGYASRYFVAVSTKVMTNLCP